MVKKETVKTDTESRILQAAEEEFLLKGLEGARTTAIAERAGVTHAMLHYYFRTKNMLFERIIEEKDAQCGKYHAGGFRARGHAAYGTCQAWCGTAF